MSNYYKYNFVSPERLYARVKEEMRSYFSTGGVDDLMFPLWTEDCIQKFRMTYFPIKQTIVCIKDGVGTLPEDFKRVREAHMTTVHHSDPFITGGSYYYPKTYEIVTSRDIGLQDFGVNINVDSYEVIHKVTQERMYAFNCIHLLQEGTIHGCTHNAPIYEIEEGKLKTTYEEATIYLTYYSDGLNDDGFQMIPDDFFIQDYIRKYLIYMLYKQIFNQTTDETFNQVLQKMKMSEQERDDAFIKADIESKKDTIGKKINRIKKSYNKNNRYGIR